MSENICIYFSDTGGGHRSAADAIEAALKALIEENGREPDICIVKDNIAEKSHPLNGAFVELYNRIMRHSQPLMKYYWWFLHELKPERGFNIKMTERFHLELLERDKPSVVVSVHPMINEFLAHALEKLGLKGIVKLVIVVTDPSHELWRPWACERADLIIVPNSVVKNRLIEFGIAEERLCVLGMPVHADFLKAPSLSRQEFLNHLGLSPDLLTICLNAGWAGTGNMLQIYDQLAAVERPLQAIFICGRNPALYEKAMAAAAQCDVPTAVLPFHDSMPDLMAAVDLMVTKAGGLTTYQALARRLPLVFDTITEPMPQEGRTIGMLVEHKLAVKLNHAHDIIELLRSFQIQADREQRALPSAYEFDLTDGAIFQIAGKILECNSPPVILGKGRIGQEVKPCDLLPRFTTNPVAGET